MNSYYYAKFIRNRERIIGCHALDGGAVDISITLAKPHKFEDG